MGQSVCLDPCSRHVEDRKITHKWLLGRKQQDTSGYLNPGSRSVPCYRQVQRFKNTTCKLCFLGPKTQIGTSETIIRLIKTVNNYSWVVRISFVSIFLYQVSFVRSDKGLDRVHRKTVGTSRNLARLVRHSQDFLGKPEEKVVSGEESIETPRNNPVWRGKY